VYLGWIILLNFKYVHWADNCILYDVFYSQEVLPAFDAVCGVFANAV